MCRARHETRHAAERLALCSTVTHRARVQGYALVEFTNKDDAESAIEQLDGTEILGQKISVTWAFVKPQGGGARRGGAAAPRRR